MLFAGMVRCHLLIIFRCDMTIHEFFSGFGYLMSQNEYRVRFAPSPTGIYISERPDRDLRLAIGETKRR